MTILVAAASGRNWTRNPKRVSSIRRLPWLEPPFLDPYQRRPAAPEMSAPFSICVNGAAEVVAANPGSRCGVVGDCAGSIPGGPPLPM